MVKLLHLSGYLVAGIVSGSVAVGTTLGLALILYLLLVGRQLLLVLIALGFGATEALRFRSLVIAAVAVNEMIGPVLFKLALDTTGESDTTSAPTRPSLAPPPPIT